MTNGHDADASRVGRAYVLVAAAVLAMSELVVTAAYVARVGTDRLPQQAVRFLLVLGLGYALLRRQRWARWVTVLLLLLGCWVLAGPLVAPGAFSRDQLWRTVPLLALFVAYGILVRGLLYSASVRAYFGRHDLASPPPA